MSCHAVLTLALVASQQVSAAQLRLSTSAKFVDDDVILEFAGLVPVSTTMKCIIMLACQYFIIYTINVIVQALRSTAEDPASWDDSCFVLLAERSQNTVNYAPMLCVLFLACRMRAIQLTYGHTERYGLPQWWVQVAMQVCTWAILGQLLAVLGFSCLCCQVPQTDNDGNCSPEGIQNKAAVACLLLVRYSL